jgi:hypothetical protein
MNVATAPRWVANRRNVALSVLFAVALSLAVALGVYNRSGFRAAGGGSAGGALQESVNRSLNSITAFGDSVAGLFGSRSPGQRAAGTLANLKQRKHLALHQRALPKVRRRPLTTILNASPVPPALPAEAAPIFNAVTDTPKTAIPGTPLGLTSTTGGAGGFPGLTPLPGGIIVPPPATIGPPETPTVPIIPTTPITPTTPVPEPASWLMMLIGFAFVGCLFRRNRKAVANGW